MNLRSKVFAPKSYEKNREQISELNEKKKSHWYGFGTRTIRKRLRENPAETVILFLVTFALTSLASAGLLLSSFENLAIPLQPVGFNLPKFSSIQAFTGFGSSKTKVYDPVALLEMLRRGDSSLVLLDLRSEKDYELGHIKNSFNIPVFGQKYIKEEGGIDKNAIQKDIDKYIKNKKTIVIYAHSQASVLPDNVVGLFSKNNFYTLSIGWNEWAHMKNMWVPESLWSELDPQDYVQVKDL